MTNKGNGKNKFHKRKFDDFNYSNYTNNVLRKKEIVSFVERISVLKGIVDSIRKKKLEKPNKKQLMDDYKEEFVIMVAKIYIDMIIKINICCSIKYF